MIESDARAFQSLLKWAIPFNIHTPPDGRDFLRGSLNVISGGVTALAPLIF